MKPHHTFIQGRISKFLAPNVLRFCVAFTCAAPACALAQKPPQVEAKAPDKTVVLRHTRGGAWFVSEPLKDEYDKLLARVGALRADLDAERITGAEAQRELENLQFQLSKLRDRIEKEKVLVSPVKVHEQSETTLFDLAPSRMLVITADNVRVVGWDGPQVKCVLDKTVLAPDDKPVDADLAGLKVVHHQGVAPDVVGKSAAERQADEAKFLASPDGAKLTPAQRESRKKFVEEIADSYSIYRDFQGKEIDTVEIDGLTYEQGNRQIEVKITSPNGGESLGGDWQRHAALTVYIPQCNAVALLGCLVNLDVKGLHSALVITRTGSQNRDYNGQFAIRDVHGPVTIDNAPIDVIEGVHGNVTISGTMELANTGTTHENGERTSYTPPPRTLTCGNIEGDLTGWFIRSDLKLKAITGRIDVRNDFGDTTLQVDNPLPQSPHRIVSESGKVEVHLAKGVLGKLPLQALTNCGTVRTNAPQTMLEETNFSLGRDYTGAAHAWRGMKSAIKEEPGSFFEAGDRLGAVLQGKERSPGFDLISRGGIVKVVVAE
ncbi:MAG TPA: hypothetical protein VG269_13810 [Tepidisphaeraceae bacterium]|jgi:hypothetical protein|nr:hypothetical protein [Tepidisphaeraceae bacterium]